MAKRKKTSKTPEVPRDMLQAKQEKLNLLYQQSQSAFSVISNAIQDMEDVNSEITAQIEEINDYKERLDATKENLEVTRSQNDHILEKFRALIDPNS